MNAIILTKIMLYIAKILRDLISKMYILLLKTPIFQIPFRCFGSGWVLDQRQLILLTRCSFLHSYVISKQRRKRQEWNLDLPLGKN